MWTGFEPEQEGVFNETYVEILQVFYHDYHDDDDHDRGGLQSCVVCAYCILPHITITNCNGISGDCGEPWQARHLYLPGYAPSIIIVLLMVINVVIIFDLHT